MTYGYYTTPTTTYAGFILPTSAGTSMPSSATESGIPPQWAIYPDASDPSAPTTCPSPPETFKAFIIANAVVTILGIIIGCRPVLSKLTGDCLGKKGKVDTIRYNWLPPLCLQILTNVVCGAIIHYTPGYAHVRVENVMMLYLIRPRISLIATTTAAAFIVLKDEYPWMYSMLATAVAELILQLMAACWVVATGIIGTNLSNNTFMVIAIFMFIGTGLTAVATGIIIKASRPYDATGGRVFDTDHWGSVRISNSFLNRFLNWLFIMMFACPAYIVSWIFFSMLISAAKEQWCPPNLQAQIAVWIVLPLLGILGGVGVSM